MGFARVVVFVGLISVFLGLCGVCGCCVVDVYDVGAGCSC